MVIFLIFANCLEEGPKMQLFIILLAYFIKFYATHFPRKMTLDGFLNLSFTQMVRNALDTFVLACFFCFFFKLFKGCFIYIDQAQKVNTFLLVENGMKGVLVV